MAITKDYSDLYPDIYPWLPGCPPGIITSAIQRQARAFCERSEAWRQQLDSINLKDGILRYELEPDWDAELRRVSEVRINTEDGVDAGNVGELIPPDQYRYEPRECELILNDGYEPREDVDKGLEVKVILVPRRLATKIDPVFLDRWQIAIIGGVMRYLAAMPGKKWSNATLAATSNVDYIRGIADARRDLDLDGTNATLSISA